MSDRYGFHVRTLIEVQHDVLTGRERYRAVVIVGNVHDARNPPAGGTLANAREYHSTWTDSEPAALAVKHAVMAELAAMQGRMKASGTVTVAMLGDLLGRAGFGPKGAPS